MVSGTTFSATVGTGTTAATTLGTATTIVPISTGLAVDTLSSERKKHALCQFQVG